MPDTVSPRPARRHFALLAGITALTLVVLGWLVLFPRPTVVELTLQLERVAFTVVPPVAGVVRPAAAGSPGIPIDTVPEPLSGIPLLDSSLEVRAFEVRRADRLELTLAAGRTVLHPGPEGSVRLSAEEPFVPDLTAHGLIRLSAELSGRDRAGGIRLMLLLEPATGAHWDGRLPAGAALTAALRDVEAEPLAGGSPTHVDQETRPVPEDGPDLAFSGGTGEGILGLTLPPRLAAGTLLRVLDPRTGTTTEPRRLPFVTAELRSLPWRDRLVLLEPDAGDTAPAPLLRPGLKVRDPELFRQVKLEPESALLGGEIRLPGSEQPPIELAAHSFVILQAAEPLTVRSLAVASGHLELVLWGRMESVRIGPVPEALAEALPNRLTWLYSRRLAALLYTVVASVLGAALGLFRLLGLFKD
jgi:hypothetical protein